MASIEFRGKGLVHGVHHGVAVRSLVPGAGIGLQPDGADTQNMVISGKQLDVLKALTARFSGEISIIYATPPYNTGTDGWSYDDDIPTPLTAEWAKAGKVGRDDPDRHDKWLAWMTPRLRLMYELLSHDGVLFISIDDNEGHRLKSLLDETFGESNALPTLVWQKRYSVPSDVKGIGYLHENILVYRKSDSFVSQLVPQTEEQLARYKNIDSDGRRWKSADYTCRWTKEQRPNLFYPIKNPHTGVDVWPKEKRVWAYSKSETARNVKEKLIWWGKTGKNKVPAFKNHIDTLEEGMVPGSLLLHEEVGHTQTAANELEELLPEAKRDGKPLGLVRHLLWIAGHKTGKVLFPFPSAGEGPQAVLLANMATDEAGGADRRFIALVPDANTDSLVIDRLKAFSKDVAFANCQCFELGAVVDAEALLQGESLPSFQELARHVFFSATGRPLKGTIPEAHTLPVGSMGDVDVHLIYRPDKVFLRSDDAVLTDGMLRALVEARKAGKRSIVFAAGKYLPHEDLVAANVEFCAFPTAIYRAIVR